MSSFIFVKHKRQQTFSLQPAARETSVVVLFVPYIGPPTQTHVAAAGSHQSYLHLNDQIKHISGGSS